MRRETIAPWAEPEPNAHDMMSASDLLALSDKNWRYELVQGRLVHMPPVGGGHGRMGVKLASALDAFVEQHALGCVMGSETGFLLSRPDEPDTVLAPAVAFVRADHMPDRQSAEWNEFWRVAPDLVAEIVSPSQFRPEMAEKARAWLAAGVLLVWVIWPSRQEVDVWLPGADAPTKTLSKTDALDGLTVLPGFTLPVARLFA